MNRLLLLLPLLWGFGGPEVLAQQQPAMPASPSASAALPSAMRTYALRLAPGQDLRQQLDAFVQRHQIRAGAIVTCVGSLTHVTLRLANQEGPSVYRGHFEIVSLAGTLSTSGSHVHLSVSDSTGRTIGGHLLAGNLIYTTAELVLGVLDDVEFRRETDPTFGYRELTVHPAQPKSPPKKPSRR
ncbi:PPC domain-containing DNA-binding protein [Hymenobacter psychrotolerans]|uniref:PPC domain-containing protein n=1 Tax=Hymenobacter psychrotolerans DSM 18569 TaxID=1121959 RepID=A0A1M6RJR1_9BACT|nr:PPC domain-containing DNA-binding protein [Hymenobacter psychrotolerans]SHK32587.1 hypothetical protein SAMN02746009_00727 [Hymenobacter psychrotolerans DSM 18569]